MTAIAAPAPSLPLAQAVAPIKAETYQQIVRFISLFEQLVHTPDWQKKTYGTHDITQHNTACDGAFLSYDFHITPEGPRLIEVNTNAGGGLYFANTTKQKAVVESSYIETITTIWQKYRGLTPLRHIAIVDTSPEQQALYAEFVLFTQLFKQAGWHAYICDPSALNFKNQKLYLNATPIDFVYNRLTDFYLAQPQHHSLKQAYLNTAAVFSPSPKAYALYADKRNLSYVYNDDFWAQCPLALEDKIFMRQIIPETRIVTPETANQLWAERRKIFFKPGDGFGSRGSYRGDKLTTRVWSEIQHQNYVAQQAVDPQLIDVLVNNIPTPMKSDIRVFVSMGKIQLIFARLYQGQTTNMRTPGGGFTPVTIIQ